MHSHVFVTDSHRRTGKINMSPDPDVGGGGGGKDITNRHVLCSFLKVLGKCIWILTALLY